jgi:hypothetical protein
MKTIDTNRYWKNLQMDPSGILTAGHH